MRKVLFLLLVLCSCSNSTYPYRLAICAMFKNEGPWLKEWVAYHRNALKVDHFYLYNNESTDNYQEVLQPYIDEGVVEVIDWDSQNPNHLAQGAFMDAPWSAAQLGAYNDCLKTRAIGKAKWVAMIDIDEFIVPVKGIKSFYALLDQAEKNKRGTVSMEWRVFGTSGVRELHEGELLTEKLTMRAADEHPWNRLVKSIHRPEAVDFCLVHVAKKLNPGFGARTFKPDQVRVHHYWSRTEKAYMDKRNQGKEFDPAIFEPFHQVQDTTIQQYLTQFRI
ncbi:MAG: glycosyltransferase family 92 protein [Parachlamydiales bacterium]|nr:glycosyltransferase family 92 protein [Parachlamydiales bacterium]